MKYLQNWEESSNQSTDSRMTGMKSCCNNKMMMIMKMKDTKKWCKEKKNKIDSLEMNFMKKSKNFKIILMKMSKNSKKKWEWNSIGICKRFSSIIWISSSAQIKNQLISGIISSRHRSKSILGINSQQYNLQWYPKDIYSMRFAIIGGYILNKKKLRRYSHQLGLMMRHQLKCLLDITLRYININH